MKRAEVPKIFHSSAAQWSHIASGPGWKGEPS
jgi:hypothetical protein